MAALDLNLVQLRGREGRPDAWSFVPSLRMAKNTAVRERSFDIKKSATVDQSVIVEQCNHTKSIEICCLGTACRRGRALWEDSETLSTAGRLLKYEAACHLCYNVLSTQCAIAVIWLKASTAVQWVHHIQMASQVGSQHQNMCKGPFQSCREVVTIVPVPVFFQCPW